ncbi:transposase for insertion sequence element IS3411 domain protein [Shigella flexneri K-304]|nr:transposase for insertion sequence element IS3411 domain protein [Shigella flexneri K-304]
MPLLDKLREQYGVGPLCSELHIAPSTYYHCQQQRHHPDKAVPVRSAMTG